MPNIARAKTGRAAAVAHGGQRPFHSSELSVHLPALPAAPLACARSGRAGPWART